LFYLGEGILVGLALYLVVFVLTLSPVFFVDGERTAILTLLLLVVALQVAAAALGRGTGTPSPPMQDWHEARRWRWVVGLGVLVTGLFVASSVVVWGWVWPGQAALLFMMGVLVLGALLRVSAMYLSSREQADAGHGA
jgi:hypothetical protein